MSLVPEFVRENVRKLEASRKSRNLTPTRLGLLLKGLNAVLIDHYERGYQLPTRENYNRLAEFFGWQKWEVQS